jgi:uncharacterized protein GlcG (DUF336 family)
MDITLQEAQAIMKAAALKAQGMGILVGIAIVDSHGDLVASVRMDGAPSFTAEFSRGKAKVAAVFGQPSASLAERANAPAFQSFNIAHHGEFVFGQGALPISRHGAVEGAVGVSGGTTGQDEEIGAAALEVLGPISDTGPRQ